MSFHSKAIEIQGLTKFYRQFRALNDISFNVGEGEFFGFLGPNGAGKTTTIHALTGLVNYQKGKVLVFGHDVVAEYRKARALIGLVPQEFNFDPFLTVEQILIYEAGYFGVPKKEAKTRAYRFLEEFGLLAHKHLDFRKLSGGMKRRLLIARALMHQPKILILDEPTAGLDLELRYKLWDFFRDINRKGITIFLTTHYIEEAEKLCNRIGVIHQGAMVTVEDKGSLVRRMSHNTIEVRLDRKLESVPGEFSSLSVELTNGGDTVRLREEDGQLSKFLKAVYGLGFEVLGVHVKKTTLEDVFRKLTWGDHDEEFDRV